MSNKGLAVVTGASGGIGLELARCCAQDGFDLLIASSTREKIEAAAEELRQYGGVVEPVEADLGTRAGVDHFLKAVGERPVAALLANVGIGHKPGFFDIELEAAQKVVDVNITGTMSVIHALGRRMRTAGKGQILITSSLVARIPGAYLTPYSASKAFLENFSYGIRNELDDTGVTVTCLMPGATGTGFFTRADMGGSNIAEQANKADPAKVARDGYNAMRKGEGGVISGMSNKMAAAVANVLPDNLLAKLSERMAKPK